MSLPYLILGTRPEIIKFAPIMDELGRRHMPYKLIHTGQHYSYNMSQVFLKELGLSKKKMLFLDIGGGSHSEQTAKAMMGLEKAVLKAKGAERPSILLVEGDTNTVLAGGLVGAKLGIPVGHVEAGLRSYDLRMPEEHNRRVVDHISTLLFAPTKLNAKILKEEKVPGKVFVTGNTVIDACEKNVKIAEKRVNIDKLLDDIDARGRIVMRKTDPVWGPPDKAGAKDRKGIMTTEATNKWPRALEKGKFVLATIHRAENVDDPEVLGGLLDAFRQITSRSGLHLVLPLHPRTVKNLKAFRLENKAKAIEGLRLIEPVGYWEFLMLMKHSSFIMSDSGGIQEEVTSPSIRKKCFVLRTSTERPEAVEAGYCEMVGVDPKVVASMVNIWMGEGAKVRRRPAGLRLSPKSEYSLTMPKGRSPYGSGDAARRIVDRIG